MNGVNSQVEYNKLSSTGLLAAIGVVFSIIGTSPLFVMETILAGAKESIDKNLIIGSLSCIFWTLTIIATFKYLLLSLQVDNKGEGGIFALFALLKEKSRGKALLIITAGSAMMVSGIIAPSITLTSSMEGFKLVNPTFPVIPVTLIFLVIFFFSQRFRPGLIGSLSGPLMVLWFIMIGLLGFFQIIRFPSVLSALNPFHAVRFLMQYPAGFILPGALFLCTAGAESVFQELGPFSKRNMRLLWTFVKVTILMSYIGQGAWILSHSSESQSVNPFFGIIPQWLLLPGIILSVLVSIIASDSVVSRSFTLVREAVTFNFWPNIKILHPTLVKGQVYLPLINWLSWLASSLFVVIFRRSSEMGAAYGLVVALNMIATSFLLINYYSQHKGSFKNQIAGILFIVIIEIGFLVSVSFGFTVSGWFSLLLLLFTFLIMLGWYFGRKIKNRYISFANLSDYTSILTELHSDKSVPIIATNLVYIIRASMIHQVESKVIYSILQRQPKRAETYWFLYIDRVDEPDRFDYEFTPIIPGILNRVDFHLGFKIEPRINLYFREVLEDLENSGEITLSSSYNSLKKFNFTGDFKYILIDRVMLRDNKLSALENIILTLHGFTRLLDITDERALHLDLTNTIVEKIPVTLEQPVDQRIKRKTPNSFSSTKP